MERKEKFIQGEEYHLFTRGVEKRAVFKDAADYDRFALLLLLANSNEKVHLANLFKKYQGEPLIRIFEEIHGEPIIRIKAYALMPNHVHLLVQEFCEGGISKFMLKLMTAYSMYFNIRYERSGPLFTRPFRSRHVDTDEYSKWVFSYINLNPLELFQNGWKEIGILDLRSARRFMQSYSYASFADYFVGPRPQSQVLCKQSNAGLPVSFDELIASLVYPRYQGEPLIH